jgi:PTS system mannose-specific IIA component
VAEQRRAGKNSLESHGRAGQTPRLQAGSGPAVWGTLMIGIVLVTHGALAIEFKSALEHVVGPQESCETVSIGPEDDMQQRRNDILAAVDLVDAGAGVIILTDMFGGTPSNLAISVMQNRDVEVIAGVNLPMLVKLARVRADQPIKQAVRIAAEAGRKYINVANDVLDS